jgi:glutathione S-transferase
MDGNSYHLFIGQRSPFARRIRLAMRRIGMEAKETFVDVFQEPAELNAANPTGMVPTLITPDFGPLGDSTNILEYLHEKTRAIWPKETHIRIAMRQASVLAVAVTQSSVLYFQETKMHEKPAPFWVEDHLKVIEATLATIAKTRPDLWIEDSKLTQAGWDIVVALDYLSLRIPEVKWEIQYPFLVRLMTEARKNSFFVESTPKL